MEREKMCSFGACWSTAQSSYDLPMVEEDGVHPPVQAQLWGSKKISPLFIAQMEGLRIYHSIVCPLVPLLIRIMIII